MELCTNKQAGFSMVVRPGNAVFEPGDVASVYPVFSFPKLLPEGVDYVNGIFNRAGPKDEKMERGAKGFSGFSGQAGKDRPEDVEQIRAGHNAGRQCGGCRANTAFNWLAIGCVRLVGMGQAAEAARPDDLPHSDNSGTANPESRN